MKKREKQIGVLGWSTGDNSFGTSKAYLTYFKQFGNVHIMTPQSPNSIWRYDLVVLPGGADVNPSRYDRIPGYTTSQSNPYLEWFDTHLLPGYIERKIPVFGICRGFQTLFVHFGVPLCQELSSFHNTSSKDRGEKVNELYYPAQWSEKADNFIGKKVAHVNSLHHQGVLWGKVPETCPFKPTLIDSEGIIVEAAIHESLPIAAVQWHPKFLWGSMS